MPLKISRNTPTIAHLPFGNGPVIPVPHGPSMAMAPKECRVRQNRRLDLSDLQPVQDPTGHIDLSHLQKASGNRTETLPG